MVDYRNLQREDIKEYSFANNVVIFANNETNLQHNLNVWNKKLQDYGMWINIHITKIVCITKENQTQTLQYRIVKLNR